MIVLDARGDLPAATFDRAIDALAQLEPGDSLVLVTNWELIALYAFLSKNGYHYELHSFPDGRFEVQIWEIL